MKTVKIKNRFGRVLTVPEEQANLLVSRGEAEKLTLIEKVTGEKTKEDKKSKK